MGNLANLLFAFGFLAHELTAPEQMCNLAAIFDQGDMTMLQNKIEEAAEQVAFGFITRAMHPALREPVQTYLSRGWGVCDFGSECTTLVREGWFGEKKVNLRVDGAGNCTIARL